jgi:hypothetical protein
MGVHGISRGEDANSEPDNSGHPDDDKSDVWCRTCKIPNNEYVSKMTRLIISTDNPEAVGVLSAVTGVIVYSYLLHSPFFNTQCTTMENTM